MTADRRRKYPQIVWPTDAMGQQLLKAAVVDFVEAALDQPEPTDGLRRALNATMIMLHHPYATAESPSSRQA